MTNHERHELADIEGDVRLFTQLHQEHTMETATYHARMMLIANRLADLRHGHEEEPK